MKLSSRLVVVSLLVLLFATGRSIAVLEEPHDGYRRVPLGSTAVSSNIVVDKTDGGGTITVSEFEHKTLWDRLKSWWTQIMNHEDSLLSGAGPRHGAGGGVTIHDENNGGTITVTIHDNPKLFARIVELSKLIVE